MSGPDPVMVLIKHDAVGTRTRTVNTLAPGIQYWPTRSLDPALPRASATLGPVNE